MTRNAEKRHVEGREQLAEPFQSQATEIFQRHRSLYRSSDDGYRRERLSAQEVADKLIELCGIPAVECVT